ncbi:hypothetical protein JR316_0000883 [Psilocybe cubensis]|uniref:Uncharacterized protein n=2 Tax=Psilocybe cubensis TaxID=181762 RepID=A0A8H8CQS2_PSICU|nr:hypothetical protein JR316_0000883 [Psilocybe cubensis]KAH9486818.1 hypothetical protein JR316_0000883 [Psilocybe cubensis]
MLRRAFLAQNRHLESTISKCILLSHYATPSLVQGSRFASRLPVRKHLTSIPETSQISEYTTNLQRYYIYTPTPRDFIRIMAALESYQPLEKILRLIKNSPSLAQFFSNRRNVREVAKELARSPKPHRSIDILNLAYHLGHTLNPGAYESVAFHLAQSRNWDMILGVVGAARKHVGHTTLRLLNWRALALMESQRYASLRRILDEFKSASLAPIRRTYHIMLSGCLRNQDMAGAKHTLQLMRESGIPMDSTTHALINNSYRKFGVDLQIRNNALVSLPNLVPHRRTAVINSMIQSALDRDDMSATFHLLSLFGDKNVFRALSLASPEFALGQVQPNSVDIPSLPNLDMKPNSDTFALFMNYCIRNLHPEGSLGIAKQSLLLGIPPSPSLVTSLVHTYFQQERGDDAINMLSRLTAGPKAQVWTALRVDSNSQRDPEFSLQGFAPLSLTTRIFNALLKGVLYRQGLSCVPIVFSLMHANHVRPNSRTIEILLSYMNQVNIPHPRTFFQVLRALTVESHVRPSIQHLHIIVSRIFRDERAMVIRSAWAPRFSRRLAPHQGYRKRITLLGTTDVFDPLAGIELGKHLSYRASARPAIQSLTAHEVKSDSAMVFLRIRRQSVLHSDVESAHRFLQTLMARGMHPNAYHFGALIEGYALAGNFSSALDVMKSASDSGVQPNAVMYTHLISAYARRQDPKSAVSMFKAMISHGIVPDVASIDAVVSAFHAKRDENTARDLLKTLWTYIQPFPESLASADLPTMLTHFRSINPTSKKAKFSFNKRIETYLQVRKIIRAYRKYFGTHPHTQRMLRRRRARRQLSAKSTDGKLCPPK